MLGVLTLGAAAPLTDPPLAGYSAAASAVERDWEGRLRALPDPDTLRESMRHLSARPHHVGSAYDRENAEWILGRFKSWGLEAQIERFDVLFPTPRERVLELVAPTKFVARLEESVLAVDPTSGQRTEQLPTYNAYSIDGDVTAPLVYVNRGIPADYEELERRGISVRGRDRHRALRWFVARHQAQGGGGTWRGRLPHLLRPAGRRLRRRARSFPRERSGRGTACSAAAWRICRLYPGDPLTPGVGATPGAKRLAARRRADADEDSRAADLVRGCRAAAAALSGPVAPPAWRGALPITYRIGPGPAQVHLQARVQLGYQAASTTSLRRFAGTEAPDEWIIRGNHHDAWVNGAEDPISGAGRPARRGAGDG